MIIATIYVLNRKLIVPGIKLTNQLTINRTRIFRNYFNDKFPKIQIFEDKKGGILRTSEIVLKQGENLISLLFRGFQLSFLFGPILIFGFPIYFFGGISEIILVRWIRWSLSKAGATFIKLGQWAATRPDILSTTFCDELSELQSNAPFHSMEWNEKVIFKSFGKSINEIFQDFDKKPIGSGTIAQVHKAKILKGKKISTVAV